MASLIHTEEVFTRFIKYFKDQRNVLKYDQALTEMINKKQHSLVIDFKDLYSYNLDLALELLSNPKEYLNKFDISTHNMLMKKDLDYATKIKYINVRFKNLLIETPLNILGAQHIGKFVMVKGIINRVSSVRPLLLKSTFQCNTCGEKIYLEQKGQYLRTPDECHFCKGQEFELHSNQSSFINYQQISIQEPLVSPFSKQLNIELLDDIANISKSNMLINVIGSLELLIRQIKGRMLRDFDYFLKANYIELLSRNQLNFII